MRNLILALCLAFACCLPAGACDKIAYNALWFSPPGAPPGERHWDEWQPVLSKRAGLRTCSWLFHTDLFSRLAEGGWDNSGWIDEARAASKVDALPKEAVLVLNVEAGKLGREYWGVIAAYQKGRPMTVNLSAMQHRRDLLAWIRARRPDVKIGYYAVVPPKREVLINGTVVQREAWRRLCFELTPLAEDVDFLVPECYPDSDWTLDYTQLYLQRQIMACRDFWPGKPVYPLLWMVHYDLWQKYPRDFTVETFRKTLIPVEWWEMEMETSWRMADGFMLWGGYKVPFHSAPWWRKTKKFLKEKRSEQ